MTNGMFRMGGVAAQLEAAIRANRLMSPDVSWRDELIFPDYRGRSVMNVAQTVLDLLGGGASAPLDPLVWGGELLAGSIERVVVILTDGLGYLYLNELIAQDDELAQVVGDLTEGRGPLPLTSVSPSTTAVALPTLWTGVPPIQHGMVGTLIFLMELGVLANVLNFRAAHGKGGLEGWGLSPEELTGGVSSIAERLLDADAPTHLLLDRLMMGTGLSRVMHRGVEFKHTHAGSIDAWLRLRDVLRETAHQRCYVNVYWPVVDTLSHHYGADSVYLRNEIGYQLRQIREALIQPESRDGQTLVMVLADHGHMNVSETIDIAEHPQMRRVRAALRMPGAGDPRFGQLYLRAGERGAVIEAIGQEFPDQLVALEVEQAIGAGLFGAGEPHPLAMQRLGDVLVIARAGIRLEYAARRTSPVLSVHSGLSEREMLIPLLWRRI